VSLYHRSEEKNRLALNFCVTLLNPIDIIIVFFVSALWEKKLLIYLLLIFFFAHTEMRQARTIFDSTTHSNDGMNHQMELKNMDICPAWEPWTFFPGHILSYMSNMNHQMDICPAWTIRSMYALTTHKLTLSLPHGNNYPQTKVCHLLWRAGQVPS